jgi:hypothetical protein
MTGRMREERGDISRFGARRRTAGRSGKCKAESFSVGNAGLIVKLQVANVNLLSPVTASMAINVKERE